MKYSKSVYIAGIVLGLLMTFQNCSSFKSLGNVGLDSLSTSTALNFAIDSNPQSLTVPAGSTVNFQVQAHGTDTLHYSWYYNNLPIPNSDSPIWTLNNVSSAFMGNYYVIVTQGTGATAPSIISQNALLTVSGVLATPAPTPTDAATPTPVVVDVTPGIASQPTSGSVTANNPFSFSITATGTNLSYQWYLNGVAIPGANQSVYSGTASSSTAGSYYVVVTNGSGSVTSSKVTLTVTPQVPTGVALQQQIFSGDTGSCSFNPPDVGFTAPITGSFTFYSFVSAFGSYNFILPYFSLLDSSGNEIKKFTLTNEQANTSNTFYSDNQQSQSAVIQLTAGQSYTLRQYYSVRWCYNNTIGTVTMGLSQIYFGGLPVFAGCPAQNGLPASAALTSSSTTNADGVSGTFYFCMPNGQWQRNYDWTTPPPVNAGPPDRG